MDLEYLKKTGEAPEFLTEEGYLTLSRGYLLKEETPKQMYKRLAKSANSYTKDKDMEDRFFEVMWKNWLCPASPICSNLGTDRGLPISCFSVHPTDSLDSIGYKMYEMMQLMKAGGGLNYYLGDIRGRGKEIKNNGVSAGVVPWAKICDSITTSTNQGNVRRGAAVVSLPIDHTDIDEFLDIRRPTGDVNNRCMNLNHGICIPDSFMQDALDGNKNNQDIWSKVLKTREETGEPFMFFSDNVNKANPQMYKDKGMTVSSSQLCQEITLFTDENHSFVCCLSSMNLMRYNEWENTDAVFVANYFLDCVMQEFIEKAKNLPGLECAVRFAEKSRAVGLGVLGWHSLLQSRMIPFDSFDAMMLNGKIFKYIKEESDKASKYLAEKYGEPEWCQGYGVRNTHRCAVAPTVSNSLISGGFSAGIDPWAANVFVQGSAKGTFIRKNIELQQLLIKLNKDTEEVWKSISQNDGSVQHLDFLSDNEKEVFKTAREINQMALIKQAAQRQKYIDQGQSLNIFFTHDADPKYIHDVHIEAWKSGCKTLYYMRSEGVAKSKIDYKECRSCEG